MPRFLIVHCDRYDSSKSIILEIEAPTANVAWRLSQVEMFTKKATQYEFSDEEIKRQVESMSGVGEHEIQTISDTFSCIGDWLIHLIEPELTALDKYKDEIVKEFIESAKRFGYTVDVEAIKEEDLLDEVLCYLSSNMNDVFAECDKDGLIGEHRGFEVKEE